MNERMNGFLCANNFYLMNNNSTSINYKTENRW